jgi:trehalose synthase
MALAPASLGDYEPIAGGEAVERARAAGEPLRGARVLHVSGTMSGGRVPELLGALLPLAVDAGLELEWRVLFGGPELAEATRALHDGLQGAETALDDSAWEGYLETCAEVAETLGRDWDAVVLHDPGTLGLVAGVRGTQSVWRCWIDASQPDGALVERAQPLFDRFAAFGFPADSFAPEEAGGPVVRAAPPGIDPLAPRNLEPDAHLPGRLVRPLGVDLTRPFVCQVLRLDRWSDPHTTIEAFTLAREQLPGLQLVLAATLEPGDEREWRAAKELRDYARDAPDFHLLTSYEGLTALELGALQRLARAGVQHSLRDGFALAASEALWQGTPVVGNPDGGLPLQVRDGVDGFLVEGPEPTAGRIVELVRDVGLAIELGRAGRERVRERFLITHAVEHELRLLAAALQA